MKRIALFAVVSASLTLAGCMTPSVKPVQDEQYAPPLPPPPPPAVSSTRGSLYNTSTAMDLYGDGRAHRVGDVLTVVLKEKTQSSKSSSTSMDKGANVSIGGGTLGGKDFKIFGKPVEANINGYRDTSGSASSDMGNSLSGNITVTVHEVRPNGTLFVRGEKWLTLNQGDEYIRISGIVRKKDISTGNEIESTKLADARITYSGKGALHDSNVAGWLSRFFMSPIWPM